MAEFVNAAEQTVTNGSNILYTGDVVKGTKCIQHRAGSGIVTLRGITNQCSARYLVIFGGNIALPTGDTVGTISVALTINGEQVGSSVMSVTPAAVNEYFNVSTSAYIDVPQGCCTSIAIQNISSGSILVNSANLIVTRVA